MKRIQLALLSVFCFLMMGFSTARADGSYKITDYDVNVNVLDNGNAEVTQKVTYDFDGDFHGVYYRQDMKGIKRILDVSAKVTQNGRTTELPYSSTGADNTYDVVENDSDGYKMKMYHRISDDKAVFTYSYTLAQMVVCYNDTAELNWKVIGTGWDHPLHNVRITVKLPDKNIGKLQAWTHGPLDGCTKVDRKDGRVIMTLDENPENTFVETHMIFPKELVPYSRRHVNRNAKASIQRKEAELARKANEKRRREQNLKKAAVIFAEVLCFVYVLVACVISPGRRTKPQGKYVHSYEIPSVTPEVAYVIDRDVDPTEQTFSAYLMRLAGEGRIEVVRKDGGKKPDYRIILKDETLLDESDFLKFLFTKVGGGSEFSIREMKRKAKRRKNAEKLSRHFEKWADGVRKQADGFGYKDRRNAGWQIAFAVGLFVVLTALLLAGIFCATTIAAVVSLVVAFIAAITACVVYCRNHDTYTDNGRELRFQIRCFKKMLEDIGRFDLKQVGDIILWEQILPYAVAFDLAVEVIEALKMEFGEEVMEQAWGSYYVFAAYGSDFDSGFSESFSSVLSSAGSSSSSSGGSGGFSGGSSGGVGGGSGGGAF